MEFTLKEMNHIFNFIVDIVCDEEKQPTIITREMCDMDLLLKMFVGYSVQYETQEEHTEPNQLVGYWFTFINKKTKKRTDIYTTMSISLGWNHWSNEKIK